MNENTHAIIEFIELNKKLIDLKHQLHVIQALYENSKVEMDKLINNWGYLECVFKVGDTYVLSGSQGQPSLKIINIHEIHEINKE